MYDTLGRGVPKGHAQNWGPGFLPGVFQGTALNAQGAPIDNLDRGQGRTDAEQRAQLDLLNRLNRRDTREQHPHEAELSAADRELRAGLPDADGRPRGPRRRTASRRRSQSSTGSTTRSARHFAKQCLMARRLVERGVRFVQIYSGGMENERSWDGHTDIAKNHSGFAGETDRPIAALLTDLKARGLLDSTLVICNGEFGRLPIVQKGGTGRDHNPHAFTTWMAGGGVKAGARHGATDEIGHKAVEDRVSINDLHATDPAPARDRPREADLPVQRPRLPPDRRRRAGGPGGRGLSPFRLDGGVNRGGRICLPLPPGEGRGEGHRTTRTAPKWVNPDCWRCNAPQPGPLPEGEGGRSREETDHASVPHPRGRTGPDSLKLEDLPEPEPGHGEVLVRVRATCLNYRDLLVIKGAYSRNLPLPLVPLSDGAGEVAAVGPGVTRFQAGDRVAGCFFARLGRRPARPRRPASRRRGGAVDGMLAEQVVSPEGGLVRVPDHLSDEEAATLPCAALTAWHALIESGGLKAGETVLVQGTGGVSLFALQFARMAGARVIATSSSDAKLARARELGASDGINYKTTPDWDVAARNLTDGLGVDHVVEVGGRRDPGPVDQGGEDRRPHRPDRRPDRAASRPPAAPDEEHPPPGDLRRLPGHVRGHEPGHLPPQAEAGRRPRLPLRSRPATPTSTWRAGALRQGRDQDR